MHHRGRISGRNLVWIQVNFDEFQFSDDLIHRRVQAESVQRQLHKDRGDRRLREQKIPPINQLADHFTLFERLERALKSCLRINCESWLKIERCFSREFIDSIGIRRVPLADKLSSNIDRMLVFQRLNQVDHRLIVTTSSISFRQEKVRLPLVSIRLHAYS